MIVLDRIDPLSRSIAWTPTNTGLPGSIEAASVESRLRDLGILDFRPLEGGETSGLGHAWSVDGSTLLYRSRCPLEELSPVHFAFYVATLLATVTWADVEDLLSVHLAVYELLVNVHEHGRPLAAGDRVLTLTIRVGRDRIEGRLVDGCEHFDVAARPRIAVSDRVADRQRRGYGTTMIERALDAITHEFGPEGNVIHFEKRIES